MCERDYAFDELLARARGEYLEMPGLCLTVSQASRLWGLDPVVCDALLTCLAASGFLRKTAAGAFRLASTDRAIPVLPHRRFLIEEDVEGSATPKPASERLS